MKATETCVRVADRVHDRKGWTMPRCPRAFALAIALSLLVLGLLGCTGRGTKDRSTETSPAPSSETSPATGTTTPGTPKGPVVIGSKIDVEGPVLGQIIIAVLQNDGFRVVDRTRTGTTEVVRKALLAGEIDGYPEYTGTALTQFFEGEEFPASLSHQAQRSYETVKKLDAQENRVVWLQHAPADNTFAIAVPRGFAERNKIRTVEDWTRYIEGGGKVRLVGSQEFFSRTDAFPAFEKAYGFKLKADQKTALATGDTAVTEKAASQGTNGANAAMAYGTDGTIAALDLVVLKDPKGVQPVYQPAPTFRKEVVDKYPELATLLDPVFVKLDLGTLQKLNGQVAVQGKDAKTVATEWLEAEGFLK